LIGRPVCKRAQQIRSTNPLERLNTEVKRGTNVVKARATWIGSRFHGVATHYLPNYLGWRWALDAHRIDSPETLLKAAIGVFHT
jgi:hypothetical protein